MRWKASFLGCVCAVVDVVNRMLPICWTTYSPTPFCEIVRSTIHSDAKNFKRRGSEACCPPVSHPSSARHRPRFPLPPALESPVSSELQTEMRPNGIAVQPRLHAQGRVLLRPGTSPPPAAAAASFHPSLSPSTRPLAIHPPLLTTTPAAAL
jgi:hypothetical protein